MSRATAIAERVGKVTNEMITFVEGLSEDQLKKKIAPEEWSIGVYAHHTAISNPEVAGMATAIAAGHPIPSFTMDMIHAGNAQHAIKFSNVTKSDVLAALREAAAKSTAMVGGLSDAGLDTSATLLTDGSPMTVEQIIQMIIVEHTQGHLESMKATLAS